jgi:uncharacterized metal-binding protein YceD (DUF177 family)
MMKSACVINVNTHANGGAARFELDAEFFDMFENPDILGGNAAAEVNIRKIEESLILNIAISGSVRVVCDRCLDEFDCGITYNGIANIGSGNDDDEIAVDDSGNIDLTQYLYESVCLSLPMQKVHALDSSGNSTCNPQMMAKLKELNCNI